MNKHHVKRAAAGERILAYAVLAFLSFLCLFFFYILIVNSTRSHADLQKGFSWLPGTTSLRTSRTWPTTAASPCSRASSTA